MAHDVEKNEINFRHLSPVRLGVVLVILGAILFVSSIGVFAVFFHAQNISTDVNDWGAFGSYLGGVLGVSISILALSGAVIAIYQQHGTEKRVSNHTIAADLMRTIERLEDSIDGPLKDCKVKIKYPDCNVERDTDTFTVLTQGTTHPQIIEGVTPKYSDDSKTISAVLMDNTLSENDRLLRIESYGLFSTTTGKLRFMRDLLLKHKELTSHNVAAMYYRGKYKILVRNLQKAGYPLESWDDITQ